MADENHSKPSYYAIIPAKVRYDPELRPNAKLLYGEITALANSKGYCFMSNSEFAENYGMDKKAVSRLISQLADKGYITVEVIRDPGSKTVTERRIWIDTPPHRQKEDTPSPPNSGEGIDQKEDTPHHQKAEENNTSKVFNNPPISPKGDSERKKKDFPKDVRDLLNKYVGNDKDLADAMKAFMAVRSELGAKQTARAVNGFLGELDTISGGVREMKIAILRQSEKRMWKFVFPIKDEKIIAQPSGQAPTALPRASHIELRDGEEVVVFD